MHTFAEMMRNIACHTPHRCGSRYRTMNRLSGSGIGPRNCRNFLASRLFGVGFFFVRPAGRTHSEVKVLYTPGKGKC